MPKKKFQSQNSFQTQLLENFLVQLNFRPYPLFAKDIFKKLIFKLAYCYSHHFLGQHLLHARKYAILSHKQIKSTTASYHLVTLFDGKNLLAILHLLFAWGLLRCIGNGYLRSDISRLHDSSLPTIRRTDQSGEGSRESQRKDTRR